MRTRLSVFILCASLAPLSAAQSAELTGRFSMLGTTARATDGDTGYLNKDNTLTADQQSLRLMVDQTNNTSEWSLHLKMARQHLSDLPLGTLHSSDLFRVSPHKGDWLSENDASNATRIGYELDRAVYKHRIGAISFAVGRQPVDWGSGRFWQPLNVFGAFAPTDLDTDFKPGIDAARLDWYPSDVSSLSAVTTFSPNDNAITDNKISSALHYRRQVGLQSQMSLLTAGVIGNTLVGASFESSWGGMGWRVEALQTRFIHPPAGTQKESLFWIAGIEYQLENGTFIAAEWYDNSRGATRAGALSNLQTDPQVLYGLQQHLAQSVFGLSLNKDLTPLLNGSYTLLGSALKDNAGKLGSSFLHQLNLIYSVSNESDLLFSLQLANGRGLTTSGQLQSEFGHLPASMTVRLRFYF